MIAAGSMSLRFLVLHTEPLIVMDEDGLVIPVDPPRRLWSLGAAYALHNVMSKKR